MDVGNLWLIHMDWVPGCAILNNIKQTNHNKSLTNQILQGSQIKKQVHRFDHQTIQTKKQGSLYYQPNKKTLLLCFPENPSKASIHLHQVWSLKKKVFHLMTQKVPFKNSNQIQESKLSSTCDTSQLLMIFSSISTLVKVPSFHSSPKKRMDFLVGLKRDKKNGSIRLKHMGVS